MEKFINKNVECKLKSWGYTDEDIVQIKEAVKVCKYYDKNDNRISRQKAIELIGHDSFINGLARAAFHWNSQRYNSNGDESVYFDCKKLFEN